MLCRLSLSRKHIATDGGSITGLHNAWPFKDETQTALFKDPVRTAQ